MDSRKKNLINEIRKLKSIKADDGFKFALRKKMFEEAGRRLVINMADPRLHNQQASNLQKIFINLLPRKQNMFLPLLLIAALLGGGAGATYASQSSLPGETLYPIKLVTEKAQTVLNINNDAKEADLHIKFSEERLNEVDKLAQRGKAKPELVKEAVDNYKKELSEAKNILANASAVNSDQSTQIAKNLADATNHDKEILVKISGEVDSEDALDILKDAWKEAVEHNDVATIELLKSLTSSTANTASNAAANNTNTTVNTTGMTNTTTTTDTGTQNNQTATNTATTTAPVAATTTVQDQQSQQMVANKIAEASHKISEAEKYIAKKEAQGVETSVTRAKITEAKTLLADAQNLLSQAKYTEAFLKAKDAHQAAQVAKEFLENSYKSDHHEKNDRDDDEIIFMLPTAPASADETFVQPVVNNHKEDGDKKREDKKEQKHENKEEQERD